MTTTEYEGRANLEAMEHAANYNAHLLSLLVGKLPPAPARVLDFGAGLGSFARHVEALRYSVSCVETDEVLLKGLRDAGLQASASVVAFPEYSFDCIYSFNVLEHIADDVGTLNCLRSRLKPRGVLVLYVPAFQILFSSMDRRVGHHRRYSIRSLGERLDAAGFVGLQLRYVDSIGFLAALAFRLLGSDSGLLSAKQVSTYDRFVFPASALFDHAFNRVCGKNVLAVASPSSIGKA